MRDRPNQGVNGMEIRKGVAGDEKTISRIGRESFGSDTHDFEDVRVSFSVMKKNDVNERHDTTKSTR
jgi:hypothetical protein